MKVFLTKEKIFAITNSLKAVISQGSKPIKLKEIAKVLGRMISLEPALGNFPLIFARAAYFDLEKGVDTLGWKGSVSLSSETQESLQKFLKQVTKIDGAVIKTQANEISVLSIIGAPSNFIKTQTIPNHVTSIPKELWCGDASAVAVCAYSSNTPQDTFYIGKLSPEEKLWSSGGRELLTVKKALTAHKLTTGAWSKNTLLYWLTDSTNLVTFLTKGSRQPKIQTVVIEIMTLAKELNCCIQPIPLFREDPQIQIADEGSKAPDSDDWSVDEHTFA